MMAEAGVMNLDFSPVIGNILDTVETEMPWLARLPEEIITGKQNKQNRTVKQLLGHLVDSASNNHQRIVRMQYNETLEFPDYTQDNDRWIAVQDYQHANWKNLLGLWKYYNLHLAHLIGCVGPEKSKNRWTDYEGNEITLQQMIEGYVWHLHLHLGEIHELLNGNNNEK